MEAALPAERHRAQWNAGWRIGHQDGLNDSREGCARLVADSSPLEDWHRGYLAGYEDGYDAGLQPVPAPKRALPWTRLRRS